MNNSIGFIMLYDYKNLLVEINKKYKGVNEFAKALGYNPRTIADKLGNIRDFDLTEVEKILECLEIPKEKILDYFFIRVG